MGNSLGRAPWGRSDTEATTRWTEGEAWEIYYGERPVGKERCGSDDRVDGRETVGNSLGRAPLGGSYIVGMYSCWHSFFKTNCMNAIVPKNSAPKTCQAVCKDWAMGHA